MIKTDWTVQSKRLYVTAYYHIPKKSMPNMGISRYLRLAPVSLEMIRNSQLVFYYEEQCIADIVSKICADWSIDLVPVRLPLKNLPQRQAAIAIAKNAKESSLPPLIGSVKEKGRGHLRGMVRGEDSQEYADNLSVWLSKLDLVQASIDHLSVNSEPIAWMDFGVSKKNYTRRNWRFQEAESNRKNNGLLHYGSEMRFQNEKLPLNASFLSGRPEIWKTALNEFNTFLEIAGVDSYPHDEETVLSQIVRTNPELFECIGEPYRGRIGKAQYYFNRVFRP